METVTAQQGQQSSSDSISRYWEAINRIAAHEAMCEERSETIVNRFGRSEYQLETMNRRMFSLGVMLLGGMAGLIVTLLMK